ncbi:reverse transcriptase domain-containing protein [Tanacetum coccineum]
MVDRNIKVDDFVKSEEAYKSTKLPKGEYPANGQGTSYRGSRPPRVGHGGRHQRTDNYNTNDRGPTISRMSFTAYTDRVIIAMLLPCPLMVGTPRKENLDKYCDYHKEKWHYTNDCYQLKRQLEMALESEKLNHLVKDVRQQGNNRGRQQGNNITNGKIINMVRVRGEDLKHKYQRNQEEDWMNTPITFSPISADDVSDSRWGNSQRTTDSDENRIQCNVRVKGYPYTYHPTLTECELEHYSGGAKAKGLRSEEKQSNNGRSGRMRQERHRELVACQLNGEFVANSEGMTKYLTKAKEHVAPFKRFSIDNIPRNQNQKANVLSKLASVSFNHLTKEVLVEVLNRKS